ncbi:MAG: 50S ribosomal protein L25/general stress protein Ctc [Nocardiopsaceae bacterium]|nr:50S ribosomal protein L25/general stress protein Ctc [Nocardiopsaceae bacterium]
MPEVRIAAEPRTEFGKGPSRRVRRAGRVPAVMYGHGAENQHLTLPYHDLMLALKTPNVLIRLEGLKSRSSLVLPKAVQRDPLKGFIEHVDLIAVRRGEKVTVEIPIRVSGEVFSGGILDQSLVQIPVEAEATHIPDGVDVDVEGMEVGTSVYAKDLALPAGATLATDPEALVLHVVAERTAAQVEADLGEGGEAAEGEEAPAAETASEGE